MKDRIRLLQPHTHAGKQCSPGERIEVDADLAEWLIHLGVAAAIQTDLVSSTESPSEPASGTGSPHLSKEKPK